MIKTILKRELVSFFSTPVAYVFILIFLMLSSVFSFFLGGLYERGQADLQPFFSFLPWLFMFLVPAISMRSWSDEKKSGSVELLLTLPISASEAMLGKFFALLTICAIALLGTTPLVITVNYLGEPDNGVFITAYLGAWLMSSAFLSIGLCMSALTKNQVVAFIFAVVISFIFILIGSSMFIKAFQGVVGREWLDIIASLSFLAHFEGLSRGVVSFKDALYFVLVSVFWLLIGLWAIQNNKAD